MDWNHALRFVPGLIKMIATALNLQCTWSLGTVQQAASPAEMDCMLPSRWVTSGHLGMYAMELVMRCLQVFA